MSRNDPSSKAAMTLAFARRTVAKLAADLAQLAVREQNRDAIGYIRHACEQVERARLRLESGTVEPAVALDEALEAFDRLTVIRGRVLEAAQGRPLPR